MKPEPYFINTPSNRVAQSLTTSIFENSNALEFHKTLESYKPTPLVDLPELALEYGVGKIFIKDESFRFGLKAFKGLGASYAIHKILENDPSIETFCTATDGNHGRAVAWSANMLGKNSRIFVPKNIAYNRIEAIELEGAIVEKVNGNYEQTCAHAKIMAEGNGWTLVQDNADQDYEEIPAHIMAGYFTHFEELEENLHLLPDPEIDIVFLQCGVGSWPAAGAWYYLNRYGKKKPRLIIVEPAEAAGFLASLKAGKRTSPGGNFKTLMAGLNCGIPSSTAWEILKETVDAAIAIEDNFMEEAVRALNFPLGEDTQVISGESGAGGFAGFIALMKDSRFREIKESLNINAKTRLLFFSTEGDTDPKSFRTIIGEI